ncbi:MAG: ABC transporter permease [Gemmatimonadota bacterium]|nr:ABC transporter permease [Gemmatimonadota bacterium]
MSKRKRKIPLLRLAFRNTRRNTRRTVLTVSAIAVACAALTFAQSYITGVLGNVLDTFARTESGHIRIRAEGYSARQRFLPLHLNVEGVDALIESVMQDPGITGAIPRIRTAVLVDGAESNRPGMLMGIDMEAEDLYLKPNDMLKQGRLPRAGYPEAMLGFELAEKLGVTVGDTVVLLGQTAYRSMGGGQFEVTALSEMGMAYFDATFIMAPIDQVQAMTYLDDASTEVLLFTESFDLADSIAASLQARLAAAGGQELEVVSWKDQEQMFRLLDSVKPVFNVILGLLLLMAGLIIVNTMLMTIMERMAEFGMQAALGMRSSDIVVLIVAEGAAIGVLGGVVGAVIGSVVAAWVEAVGINIQAASRAVTLPFQGTIYPDWQLSYAVTAAVLGIVTAAIATLYPALRAIKLKPAEALRSS